jgi:hypothetical protein
MVTELTHYNAARKALAQARRVDEVKEIRDKARAMETYARLAKDHELMKDAMEIRKRAEIRAGELLLEMKARGERADKNKNLKRGDKVPKSPKVTSGLPKLSDLGISKMESSRWQKLAKLPKDEQERRVALAKDAAFAAMDKPVRKEKSSDKREDDHPISLVSRLLLKLHKQIAEALRSLTKNERSELIANLRVQLDDIEKRQPS